MIEICEKDMCAGCMACVDACPQGAVTVEPGAFSYRPVINQGKCTDCGRCTRTCQQLHPAVFAEPVVWYQGWTNNPIERASSSSGGFASSIARAFIDSGGVVCSCVFFGGRFGFEFLEESASVDKSKGSKYVKSDPTGVYRRSRELLLAGRRVLFVGLPCQVSAMRNFIGNKLSKRLYTVDLICHGSPSPILLEIFLNGHGVSLDNLQGIEFRRKSFFQVRNDGITIEVDGVIDRYLMAFLEGLSYTENCYSCAYARKQRVSDLTLGDSWGSDLSEELQDGISLALCQTEKGKELLRNADLELRDVCLDIAISNNGQLMKPAHRPPQRDRFIKEMMRGKSFERAVAHVYPKWCLKQNAKRILSRLGILKSSGGGVQNNRIFH